MKIALTSLVAFVLAAPTLALAQGSVAPGSEEESRAIFQQMDQDGDKALTPAEAEAAGISTEVFQELDVDGDGALGEDEYIAAVHGEPSGDPSIPEEEDAE